MNAGAIGRSKWELETPSLLVDLDVAEQNIARLASFCRERGVGWRPHVKAVRVPELALKQVAAGAIGVTCASVAEAEVMAAAGISDILIANQIVGAGKVSRLADLLSRANLMVAVDSLQNAEELSGAMHRNGKVLRILIEVNIGMDRAGVQPGERVASLAQKVSSLPGLRFVGLTGYEGHCAGIRDSDEKRAACEKAIGLLLANAASCRAAGFSVEIVSCSGTVTSPFTAHLPGITEIQAGGGTFSDILYESYGVPNPFALTVLSTVTSRPTSTRVIVDAGRKAMSVDVMLPRPRDLCGVELVRLSAEHGKIELDRPNHHLKIGDKVEWVVGYADTTVVLHHQMVGARANVVEAVWTLPRRGP